MDPEILQEILLKWRNVLGLPIHDWDITIRYGTRKELGGKGSEDRGEVRYQAYNKRAEIVIIHPDEYFDSDGEPQDIETTIVHELMHLKLVPFSVLWRDNRVAICQEEQFVNSMTKVLVNMARAMRTE